MLSSKYPEFKISKKFKNGIDKILKDKQKTHRSCFRKIFTNFVGKDEIFDRNGKELYENNVQLIDACQGLIKN